MGGGKGGGSSRPSAAKVAQQSWRDKELRQQWEVNQNQKDANTMADKERKTQAAIHKQYQKEVADFNSQSKDLVGASRKAYEIQAELESRSGMDVFESKNLFKGGTRKSYTGPDGNKYTKANANNNVDSTYADWKAAMIDRDPDIFRRETFDKGNATFDSADYTYDQVHGTNFDNVRSNSEALYQVNKQNGSRSAGFDKWIDTSERYYKDATKVWEANTATQRGQLGEATELTQDWKDAAKGYKTDTVGEVGKNLTFASRGGAESSQTSKNITKTNKDTAVGKKGANLGFSKSKTLGDEEETSTLG